MEAVSVRQVAANIPNDFRQLNLREGGDHRQQQQQQQQQHQFHSSSGDGEDDDNDDQIEEEKTRSEFSTQVAVERQTLESQESKGGLETKASKLSRLSREEPEKLHEWLAREIEGRFNHQSSATLDKSNSRISSHYTTGATDSASAKKKKTSFLEALIEGRKSWLDQKTVIVDINNGRRALNKVEISSNNKDKSTDSDDTSKVKKLTQHNELSIQNSKTLAANKQSKSSSARKKEGTAESKESASSKKDSRNQDKLIAVAEGESAVAGVGEGVGIGGTGGDVKAKDKQDTRKESSQVNGKEAENRQQVQPRTTIEAAKERRLPTFGGTPSRITRLPYYSYYGKARNVEIVTAANRKDRLEQEQSSDSASGSSGSSQRSSSSPASGSKIPTLSQVSAFGSGAGGAARGAIGGVESEIDQEDRRELELTRRSQRQYRTAGYSNISNLFPAKQMSNRQDSHRQQDQQSASGTAAPTTTASSRKNLRFSSTERDRARQQGKSSSLLNLTSPQSGRARSTDRYRVGSALGGGSNTSTSGFNRRNSLSSYTHNYRTNRSMNSLNASPYSNASDNNILPTTGSVGAQVQQTGTGAAMRRQNSNASYVNNKQRPPSSGYQGRSASASGYIGRNQHHRSPSASSLHYGSAGVSPYGPPPVDPDCPVHGYSPVNGMHSKSSQHLAGNADSADLLYEPYNSFYADHRPNQQVMQPGGGSNSLYSPTSPQSPLINQRPASAYGLNSSSRQQVNSAPAYYNNSSRFSMYHSPALTGGGVGAVGGVGAGGGGAKTSLAPTNEQLRRILGYQPHTKPIYLHPQWAYSRPFIHLQGTRSPSPGSPLFDPDDPDDRGDIRPRFEPYNQLHDTQAIRAVDFHPSGEVYAVGSNSRALRICAYPADYELRHFGQDHVTTAPRVLFKFLQVHRGSIYCVRFNSTGQLLATGSNDQTVHIVRYNSVTHSPDGDEYRLTMHDGTVRDLCFIDDPTNGSSVLLSAGGGDNKIYVTDCDTITPFQSMAGHTQMIMALNHWGGANFVSASYDRTIRFWDLRTRACTSIISAPPGYGTAGKRVGPGAPACAVEVDSSGRLLASGHSDSTCMLYDIRGARIIQAFKPHDDEIRTVSFSPKSYYLLTGGYDGRIVLSDLQGDLTQPLPSVCVAESDDKIVQSKWHPSDFTFMTTSADKTATLWALPTE